jgi:glycosyltransferase involved in cell wall biosynthesis
MSILAQQAATWRRSVAGITPLTGISILIPAYHEEDGIGAVLEQLQLMAQQLTVPSEIIVVDDGSDDSTGEVAARAGVVVKRHDENRGYGAALKTALRCARYEAVVIADADGSYPCDQIPKLVSLLGEYDMVVGARTGANVNMPASRIPAKWLLGRFANYVAGMQIPDLNSGLRAFRKDVALEFFHMLPDGFSFTSTITLAMLTSSYNVAYVPVDYHRRTGRSKIRPIADTVRFFALATTMALYFRPLRVFLPVAAVFTAVSLGKVVYDAVVYDFSLRGTTLAALFITAQVYLLAFVADLIVAQRRMR